MLKIHIYSISEEQFKNTEYRPIGTETIEIETENNWDYADVIENQGGYDAKKVVETNDLYVFKVTNWEDENDFSYVVQVKK